MAKGGVPEPEGLGSERSGDVVPLHDRLPKMERGGPVHRDPGGSRPGPHEPELPGSRGWTRTVPVESGHEAEGYVARPEPFGPAAASALPGRLQPIVEAAERAAEDVRQAAETRARARIAEADRAAEHRIRAAELEVSDMLAGAQAEAERLRLQALETVGRINSEAEERRREAEAVLERARQDGQAIVAHARQQAAAVAEQGRERGQQLLAEAEAKLEQVRAQAREDARAIVSDAHAAAREVGGAGDEVTENLRELSVSLRNNAERLLRDIRMVHTSMMGRLERLEPELRGGGAESSPGGAVGGGAVAGGAASEGRVSPGQLLSARRPASRGARDEGGPDVAAGGAGRSETDPAAPGAPQGREAEGGGGRRSLLRRGGRGASAAEEPPPAGEFDVPEFIPRPRRR